MLWDEHLDPGYWDLGGYWGMRERIWEPVTMEWSQIQFYRGHDSLQTAALRLQFGW
jgi:hypothetical protein